MSDHSGELRYVAGWTHIAVHPQTCEALTLAADVLDAIPGDDKALVAEWAVKIARLVAINHHNVCLRILDLPVSEQHHDVTLAIDDCPPSVRAALRGES